MEGFELRPTGIQLLGCPTHERQGMSGPNPRTNGQKAEHSTHLVLAWVVQMVLWFTLPLSAAQISPVTHASSILQGTVRTSDGYLISNATVTVQRVGSNKLLTTYTARNGTYSFADLAAGNYSMHSEKTGCGTAKVSALKLSLGKRNRLDFVLKFPDKGSQHAASCSQSTGSQVIHFSNEPQFKVAGLTNWEYVGGYGSESHLRTADDLSRETNSLKGKSVLGKGPAQTDASNNHPVGNANTQAHDALETVRIYKRAVRQDPSEKNYFDLGSELLLHQSNKAAVQVFTDGHKAHPSSARMLIGLGVAYYGQGSSQEAVHWLSAAADLGPDSPTPYLFLGKMQAVSSSPLPGIKQQMERFVRLRPANAWANYYDALCLWKQRRGSKSFAGLDRVQVLIE